MDRRKLLRAMAAAPAALSVHPGLAPAQDADRPDTTNPGLRSVHVNGADLNYSMAGAADAPPLIVLHGGRGFGQHGGVFADMAPLADRYKVIGFDMRGHGHSSVTPPFTFDQMCDDIEQLRQTLGGGQKLVLQGGSFGSFIAQQYALRYPASLSHLILRGAAASHHQEEQAMANFEARRARKAPLATPGMLRKVFTPTITDDEEFRLIMFALAPMYLPDDASPNFDRILENSRRGIYRARVHNDLYEPTSWHSWDLRPRLHEIAVPTLVICGAEDWICDPIYSREIASRIPRAKLVVVPGSNHGVPGDILLNESRLFLAENA